MADVVRGIARQAGRTGLTTTRFAHPRKDYWEGSIGIIFDQPCASFWVALEHLHDLGNLDGFAVALWVDILPAFDETLVVCIYAHHHFAPRDDAQAVVVAALLIPFCLDGGGCGFRN